MSPLASGLGSQFVLAKEATYGVIPGSPAWRAFEFDSSSLALDQNTQDGVGLRAGRIFQPVARMRQTTREAGGDTPMDVPSKGFGSILDLMHGLVVAPVQQAATPAYKSTHNIGTSLPNKSAVLQVNKPQTQGGGADYPVTYPGGVLLSAAFSLEVGGLMKATLNWDAQDELTPDTSPAGPSLVAASYLADNSTFVGTVGVSLTIGGVAVAVARALRWTWTQPFRQDRFFLGTSGTKQKPIPNGFGTVTGEIDVEWFDATAYNHWRNDDTLAIVADVTGRTISGAYKEQFKNTFGSCKIRGQSPAIDGQDVLDSTIPFVAGDDGVGVPWVSEYQSTDTAL